MLDSFPPPWSVEELDGCMIVWDRNGQAITYVYFEDAPQAIDSKATDARRCASDCCQYSKAAIVARLGV